MMSFCTHGWDLDPAEAVALQRSLAPQVSRQTQLGEVLLVGGVDVGFVGNVARAAITILTFPELTTVETAVQYRPVAFPYLPGLLSFREAPAVLVAAKCLSVWPDVLIVDGQGIAHPRRLGLASHLGLCLDLPTIGCAKTLLLGTIGPVGEEMGATAEIVDQGEVIGAAVRTRRNVKPVYVSIGHKVDLPSAIGLVLQSCRGYRLPEPQRRAHRAASPRA